MFIEAENVPGNFHEADAHRLPHRTGNSGLCDHVGLILSNFHHIEVSKTVLPETQSKRVTNLVVQTVMPTKQAQSKGQGSVRPALEYTFYTVFGLLAFFSFIPACICVGTCVVTRRVCGSRTATRYE